MVVVVAQALVQQRPQVKVRNAERFSDLNHASINATQEAVDELQSEKGADLFFPRLPDTAVPEASLLFGGVLLLEPRLAHDEHTTRTGLRSPDEPTEMLLEIDQHDGRVRHRRSHVFGLGAHPASGREP